MRWFDFSSEIAVADMTRTPFIGNRWTKIKQRSVVGQAPEPTIRHSNYPHFRRALDTSGPFESSEKKIFLNLVSAAANIARPVLRDWGRSTGHSISFGGPINGTV
jgi:hypothetical protein